MEEDAMKKSWFDRRFGAFDALDRAYLSLFGLSLLGVIFGAVGSSVLGPALCIIVSFVGIMILSGVKCMMDNLKKEILAALAPPAETPVEKELKR
jgi:hypothetical protein